MAKIAILAEMFYYYDGKTFQSGGGENYLFTLYQTLIKNGNDVNVYQFSWEQFTNKYKNNMGAMTIRGLGNVDKFGQNYLKNLQAGVDMFNEKTKDADIYILLTMNLAYKKLNKPTIGIFHGIYWNFESETYKQPEWNDSVRKWCRNVDKIISVDTDCINWVRANYPKFISKCEYIPNWCDTTLFIPKEREDDKKFKILYARRLNELRGINLFLSSAKELVEKYDDIVFTVCGKGLGNSEEQISNWCKNHKNCNYTNHDLSEMQDEYPNHDVNVVPSIASEGLSLSMLEAMSCGLCTIATDVGGIPNALINDFNGIMIQANNQKQLTEAIERVYLNRSLTKEFGTNGRKIAETFDKKKWEAGWINIISNI